jgi:hypothetical protein
MIAAKMAMIAITTSNSMSVKPRLDIHIILSAGAFAASSSVYPFAASTQITFMQVLQTKHNSRLIRGGCWGLSNETASD